MTATRRWTHRLTNLLLLTAAVLLVGVVLAQATGRYRFVPVRSGSMSPSIESGDLAVLQPRGVADVHVGDAIAFEPPIEPTTLTIHRIVEVVSSTPEVVIRTKGDANEAADPWRARLHGEPLWVVTGHVDGAGEPVLFLQRRSTRLIIFGFVALAVAAWGLRRIWNAPSSNTSQQRMAGISSVVAVALLTTAQVTAAAASFTGSVVGVQRVSSARVAPPTDLRAELTCTALAPSAVNLTWIAAPRGPDRYEIYKGALLGGPYDTLVADVDASRTTYTDDLADDPVGTSMYYVVRAGWNSWTSDDSNEASVLAVCE